MALVHPSSTAPEVQMATAAIQGVSGNWSNRNYWREFLTKRRQFFSNQDIPAYMDEKKRQNLTELLTDWIKNSSEWWGGDWVDNHPDITRWHIKKGVQGCQKRQAMQAIGNQRTDKPQSSSAGGSSIVDQVNEGQSSFFYDAVRDIGKWILLQSLQLIQSMSGVDDRSFNVSAAGSV